MAESRRIRRFTKEEKERALQMNETIGAVTNLRDEGLAVMKQYFKEAQWLVSFIELKIKLGPADAPAYDEHYQKAYIALSEINEKVMQQYEKQKVFELEYREFAQQVNWWVKHIERVQSREERSEAFAEMEGKTEKILHHILALSEEVNRWCKVFHRFRNRVMVRELN
jgi:hypothetical protein